MNPYGKMFVICVLRSRSYRVAFGVFEIPIYYAYDTRRLLLIVMLVMISFCVYEVIDFPEMANALDWTRECE